MCVVCVRTDLLGQGILMILDREILLLNTSAVVIPSMMHYDITNERITRQSHSTYEIKSCNVRIIKNARR